MCEKETLAMFILIQVLLTALEIYFSCFLGICFFLSFTWCQWAQIIHILMCVTPELKAKPLFFYLIGVFFNFPS